MYRFYKPMEHGGDCSCYVMVGECDIIVLKNIICV